MAWTGSAWAPASSSELLLIDRSSGAAYAHATGFINKEAAVPPRWVPPVGIPPIAEGLTLDTGSTGISWTTTDRNNLNGTAVPGTGCKARRPGRPWA